MGATTSFRAEMREILRQRVLDAAVALICTDGWGAVTMSRIAERVGVHRQSLYTEIGTKQALGEAVVARETELFLDGVDERLRAHADPVAGLTAAAEFALTAAADNPLIKTIIAGASGHDGDLLPLLASRTEPVLQRAIDAVTAQVRDCHGESIGDGSDALVEIIVRLTLSHLVQPTNPVDSAVAQIRSVIVALVRPG
ncbi:TetR/AcrR family transcriptional regulator [Saccharopolyspora dendranthemae]|uniref:TetR family transcriptional regulator n=1 Tax=Saccharopolyspora dendranthemae TaxID=1181886 RepID=A0A561V7X2_9PSEU|nr:TetR family transcriptional regulator [Saccharopolyspora dendranthemae]TWG07704.1 TetR family transcriptional regulator [Saccharopolyspora dendranthemae]